MELVDTEFEPKYKVIPDSNKVCYLILHIGLPIKSAYSSRKTLLIERKVAKILGIKVDSIKIKEFR